MKANQEGGGGRTVDESNVISRKAQGSAEVDGHTGAREQIRNKYRMGRAGSPDPTGGSRMKLRDYNPDPEKVMYKI